MKITSVLQSFICSLITLYLVVAGGSKGIAYAQENDKKVQPYISWVGQYPVLKDSGEKVGTAKRIFDFLVQKNKESTLSRPVAVIGLAPANLWILDQGDETVVQVRKNKPEIPRSVKKKESYFTSLVGACSMPNGNILFTDSRLNKVFLLSDGQKRLVELGDTLKLQQPTGIAWSVGMQEIWVVETNAHRISVLDKEGHLVKRIGGRGSGKGEFNFPTSIWIDKNGDVYVVDAMNFRVQIFNKDGAFITMFGEAGDTGGSFARPKGIATDSYGNIYVADALFHAVQIFDRAGNFLYSFGRQGREKAEFWMPAGIYIDSQNHIYVADSYNARIQIFQLINGS